MSYLPLAQFCPALQELIQLRPLLGLRSPVNTLSRMINPLHAPTSLQSIFHPAYARLHQEADLILGQASALVFKGDSGEVEVKPQADTRLHRLHNGQLQELTISRSLTQRVDRVETPDTEPLRELWCDRRQDNYGLNATLATTATALLLLRPELDVNAAQQQALQLWQKRHISRLN